ncbi:unnamed protein product [Lampetra planeri]
MSAPPPPQPQRLLLSLVLLLLLAEPLLVPATRGVKFEPEVSRRRTCGKARVVLDYYFEYTECDSSGLRWRVAVPHSPGLCTGLPEPVRGTECTFSCGVGEYLDLRSQECSACAAGTFSLGSGVRFDEWDELPPGFAVHTSTVDSGGQSPAALVQQKCRQSVWTPHRHFIMSNRDECMASLVYAVTLKTSGEVSFEYQYPDSSILFEFFVQNDQCQATENDDSNKFLLKSKGGVWRSHTVKLNSGNNVLYWRTTGILLGTKIPNPVLVRNVHITGVSYTSECFPCKPGTCSAEPGAGTCTACPRDMFSPRGAHACTPCNTTTHYAEIGSAFCALKPPCTDNDYFQLHTGCDEKGQTQVIFRWIEPKICREDLKGATHLPVSGAKRPCPPCNAGFYNTRNSTCVPCPTGTYSNGTSDCVPCPAGTEPVLGFDFKWWNMLPDNMETTCFNVGNQRCDSMNGWEVAGDHIYSGAGSNDDDYLILFLHVAGFRTPSFGAGQSDIASITFVFEMQCLADCELHFMLDMGKKTAVVESWRGTQPRQAYRHIVTRNESLTFTWAFQRTATGRKFHRDVAQIYSVEVTGALDGVASRCRPCALGPPSPSSPLSLGGAACVACPPGHFVHRQSSSCRACPAGTALRASRLSGEAACVRCGPGTVSSPDRSYCYSNCTFSWRHDAVPYAYDFSELREIASVTSHPSFTAKGTSYYHHFNISLCGGPARELALCADNVTSSHLLQFDLSGQSQVMAHVCFSTLMPTKLMGARAMLSTHPVSLADRIIGVSIRRVLDNITADPVLFPDAVQDLPDVVFYFRSSDYTSSCPTGRASSIQLRCNLQMPGKGVVSLPSKCPEGTCDGCSFHLLWESRQACPLCSKGDYREIIGSCVNGIQKKHYVLRETAVCRDGVRFPAELEVACELIGFWLKVGLSIATFTACLLVALICHFWKKNQRLEHKYSRLVMSTGTKDGGLPVADSCGVMEDEEMEDEVLISNNGTRSLLGKLKAMGRKDKDNDFESVQLKTSHSQGPI